MIVISWLTGYILAFSSTLTSSQVHFPFVSDRNDCSPDEVCMSFRKCETAFSAWKQFRTQPKSCYFKGTEQFVCCATSYPEPSTKAIKKTLSEKSEVLAKNFMVNVQKIYFRRMRLL